MKRTREADISELVGKRVYKVESDNYSEIKLYTQYGVYIFDHRQDCCESVSIDDICGDLKDLESMIFVAEERVSGENPEGYVPNGSQDSFTWTFYHFETAKGYVDIRWYGESNEYYSEEVDLNLESEIDPTSYEAGYKDAIEDASRLLQIEFSRISSGTHPRGVSDYVRSLLTEPMKEELKNKPEMK